MLKLVVDNRRKVNMNTTNAITCRNSCDLFDEITERCSIKQNVNVDSAFETSRCGHFLSKESMEMDFNRHIDFKYSLMETDQEDILDDDDVFHEFVGKEAFEQSLSTYPLHPDYPSRREDANWYISPCGTYGCWIINQYKRPTPFPSSLESAEKGWSWNVYRSPIPLHDHKTSLSLASKMAWVVGEDGFGQYCLLVNNGKISTISSPKPTNWQRKY